MRFLARIEQLSRTVGCLLGHPAWSARRLSRFPDAQQAVSFAAHWPTVHGAPPPAVTAVPENPLHQLFEARHSGRGIHKWAHYFDAYHRHLQKFVGTDVHLVEVGVYSGGSLELWRDYLGPRARITGIDIMQECTAYSGERIAILIGDQADRDFWRRTRESIPPIDVLIDDGGHSAEQQRVTLEETLPFLRPGGVFICEDIHKSGNRFAAYVQALADELNANPEQDSILQTHVLSVHLYPYLAVIERSAAPVPRLHTEKRGTEWAPYSTKRHAIERATQGTT
jgi:hypothetical protein